MTAITPRSAWVGPLCSCLIATSAFACRYSVRDVGFVDMGEPPYRLFVIVRDDTPTDWVKACQRAPYSTLLDSNAKLSLVNLDKQKDHEVTRHVDPRQPLSAPAAILVSPQGTSLRLYPPPAESHDTAMAAWLDGVVVSPARLELVRATVETYCAILLIECDNAPENRKAEQAINDAIDETRRAMGSLPKPITHPPRLVRLSASHRKQENVLLWSLGIDASAGTRPSAAVIYGRGRRIGPVLTAPAITQASLISVVSLVGESCECGLDRQQMLGVMIPLRWEEDVRTQATRILGFDPENPMVRTEVAQILSMSRNRSTEQSDRDALEVMGYSEQLVEIRSEPNDVKTDRAPVEEGEAVTPAATQPVALPSGQVPAAPSTPANNKVTPGITPADYRLQAAFSMAWVAGGVLVVMILIGGVCIILWAQRRAA